MKYEKQKKCTLEKLLLCSLSDKFRFYQNQNGSLIKQPTWLTINLFGIFRLNFLLFKKTTITVKFAVTDMPELSTNTDCWIPGR